MRGARCRRIGSGIPVGVEALAGFCARGVVKGMRSAFGNREGERDFWSGDLDAEEWKSS